MWRIALYAALVNRLTSVANLVSGLHAQAAAHLAFAPQNGIVHYLKAMQSTDKTFKGLYHWNAFDAALLIPYFLVMIVLAIYGVHRYTLCYLYFKYSKNCKPDPPSTLKSCRGSRCNCRSSTSSL